MGIVNAPSIDPHLQRWMMFVDGENLTCRAQKWAEARDFQLSEGKYYLPNVFIWMPEVKANAALTNSHDAPLEVQSSAIRSYYYTSVVGDDQKLVSVRRALRQLGFHPEVFKKSKQSQKTKGVDITLAKDFLSNAFHHNYDVAVLIAGDGDYAPLVNEVKRLGKVVYVGFFRDKKFGLNEELELASDYFFDIGTVLRQKWRVMR